MLTVNVREMILRMGDTSAATLGTKQRCAGRLSVSASLLHNTEEARHIKCNCLERARGLNVVKTCIYQWQKWENMKVFHLLQIQNSLRFMVIYSNGLNCSSNKSLPVTSIHFYQDALCWMRL